MKKYTYLLLIIPCLCLGAASPICSANLGYSAKGSHRGTNQAPRIAPLFDSHSNFWVNLHQVMFHEALLRAGKPDRRLQSNTPLAAAQMSEQEKADWNAAVAFYAAEQRCAIAGAQRIRDAFS